MISYANGMTINFSQAKKLQERKIAYDCEMMSLRKKMDEL
jgi:hypothetical protein